MSEELEKKIDLLCLLAFEAGKTFENRYKLFFPDDLAECLSIAISRGGQFPKESCLNEKMFNVLANPKYSKETIISSLNEPWEAVKRGKVLLFNREN